jgi:hypothetical protein
VIPPWLKLNSTAKASDILPGVGAGALRDMAPAK